MKSTPPDEAAPSGDLQVAVSGTSIEMRALLGRLLAGGAKLVELPLPENSTFTPQLVVCDLAAPGALATAAGFYATRAMDPEPRFVALGTTPGDISETENALLARARQRFPRPLDIQHVAQALLMALREPRPSARAPQSHGTSLAPLKGRGSQAPRISASPPVNPIPSQHPSSLPAPAEPAPPSNSRPLANPNPEHSVVSPELETLLAEAERRLHSQLARGTEAEEPSPSSSPVAKLSDDVWDALAEPLEEELDNPLLDAALEEEAAPSPPLVPGASRSLEPLPGASTSPPLQNWDDSLDEPTGAHTPTPESEQTSGGPVQAITSAGPSAPATLAPRGRQVDPDEPGPNSYTSELPESEGPATQTPGPPSTSPRGAREPLVSTRPPRAASRTPLPSFGDESASAQPPSADERGEVDPESEKTGAPAISRASSMPQNLELPGALVRGAAAVVMGRAVRQRFSGCLAFEVDQGLRRVVFKDGDIVIAASAVHGESLVSFLAQRGDIAPDAAAQIEPRIPTFGRHAGAALIARGILEQGELWPVLRAHSEWVLAQLLSIERGSVQVEYPIAERLAAEPSVFGAVTGAEALVEVVQRAVPPAQAWALLGSESATVVAGEARELLAECALSPSLAEAVAHAHHLSLSDLISAADDEPMLPCVLYALLLLGVIETREVARRAIARPGRVQKREPPDALDDAALRAKVLARRALVDEGDYFALLGVPRQATGYDIRRSYTELRRQFDPGQVLRPNTLDLQPALDTILTVLDEAYEILRDQQRRERYRRAIESLP